MSRRRILLGSIAATAALLVAGGTTRLSSAAFTTDLTASGSVLTADRIANHFSVAPGSDATGDVDTLEIDLGLVASPGTVAGVFTVTNVTGQSRTATLEVLGPGQVASAAFAASGTGTAVLAPGASSAVSVTTSPTVAGSGTGVLRLRLGGSTWLYRDYGLVLEAAPSAPGSLDAVAKPAGRVDLAWSASATTGNLAGYHVYRSAGTTWSRLTTTPLGDTSYSDTATADGVQYTYAVRGVSTGSPSLESLDSPHATARADATPPVLPSAVQIANGGGQGGGWVNSANASAVSVSVTLPGSSAASDVLTVTLSNGAQAVSKTVPAPGGSGVTTVTGLDASALPDGTVTIAATLADAAGNTSAPKTATVPKDTVAPNPPTAAYVDERNAADAITGTAEANATIIADQTAPASSGPYTATADGSGAYIVSVANTKGSPGKPITVTYVVSARDAAGNTSAATTLVFEATR